MSSVGVPGVPGAPAVAPSGTDVEFTNALRVLRNPSRWGAGLVLVVSFALFVLARQKAGESSQALVVLVGVLLLHELGHYAGMRLFGYRDVRMFFIPFLGAAVSGRRGDVAPWKEGVVLLLGPVPGIVVAFVLAVTHATDSPGTRQLALSLVTINAFNLLPLAGLDGARLLQHVLFSRRRWLEILFQVLAALAMGAYAIKAESWVLGLLSYVMLATVPHRWRVLGAANQLRAQGVTVPVDPRELDGDAARAVFHAARGTLSNHAPKQVAAVMEQLVDAVTRRSPSLGASAALAGIWLFSVAFAFVTIVLVVAPKA